MNYGEIGEILNLVSVDMIQGGLEPLLIVCRILRLCGYMHFSRKKRFPRMCDSSQEGSLGAENYLM